MPVEPPKRPSHSERLAQAGSPPESREHGAAGPALPDAIPLPAVLVRRHDGLLLAANDLFGPMLGLSPSQLSGRAIQDFCADPADREALLEAIGKDTTRSRFEVCAKAAGSASLWVELWCRPLPIQEKALIVFYDIAKEKSLEQELVQRKKMEVVGRLAGGIAHDFNNLLTVIVGWSDIALGRMTRQDPLYAHLEEVKKAADRAGALTRQLLSFSRRDEHRRQVFDLNRIVSAMDTMLQRLIGEDIQLDTVLNPEPVYVKANPSQVEQIVMNLAVNARDAMPQGGILSMKTARAEITTTHVQGHAIRPGPYVILTLSDTGHGMDPETKARIFEPFFTTKGPEKGTGLGLSTVADIVKQFGGLIVVHSEPRMGCTFTIYLPQTDSAPSAGGADAPPTPPSRGTETVLVAEDDPGIRRLIRKTLLLFGYTILEARHGIEAWMIGNRYPGPIHLLVTDVVMPQMSGRAVADRLVSTRPDIRVLYISGYTDDSAFLQGVPDPRRDFLQKPFSPYHLAQKVRDLLDADLGRRTVPPAGG